MTLDKVDILLFWGLLSRYVPFSRPSSLIKSFAWTELETVALLFEWPSFLCDLLSQSGLIFMLLVKFIERHTIIVSSSPFFRQKKRHRQFIKVINFLRLLVEATSDFISLSE